jgi:hypothetical protein
MNPVDPFIDTEALELNNLLSAARPELEASDVDFQTSSPAGRDYTIWTGTLPGIGQDQQDLSKHA